MFGLGFSEIVVITIVLLVLVNPKELPAIARKSGKVYSRIMREFNGFKKTFKEFENEVKELAELEPIEKDKTHD